jgi:hypothetical protein
VEPKFVARTTEAHADEDEGMNFTADVAAVMAALAPSKVLAGPPRAPRTATDLELQLRVASGQADHYRTESEAHAARCGELQQLVSQLRQELDEANRKDEDESDKLLVGGQDSVAEIEYLRVRPHQLQDVHLDYCNPLEI